MMQPAVSPPRRGGGFSRPVSRLLFAGGLLLTGVFTAYLTLPLLALYVRSPVRALGSGPCCPMVIEALRLSLVTSLTTTSLTLVVGTPVAWMLGRKRFRGSRLIESLVELPLTLPPVVAGVALLLVFGRQGLLGRRLDLLGIRLSFTPAAVVMAQFMVASPYYVRTAVGAFRKIPQRLLDASRTLGAGPVRTFFLTAVPLAGHLLAAGLVLTWARAMGEFGATVMFAGNFPGRTQTMPLAVLTAMQQNLQAGIVMSAVLLTVCIVVFAVVRILGAPIVAGWDAPGGNRNGGSP